MNHGSRPPFLLRVLREWWLFAAIFVAISCGARAGDATPPPVPVVQMSPYEVSAASLKFQHWNKITSNNFTVYTDASPTEGIALVRQMEMLHLALQHFFGRTALRRAPMIFVLPTSGSDWRKMEARGQVEWAVAIADPAHTVVDFITTHYDWQAGGPALMWAELGGAELYWLNLPQPLWFERGVMGFTEAASIAKDSVTFGRSSRDMAVLAEKSWLPWPRIFEVTEDSREFKKESEIQRLDGQSALVVHYMMSNSDRVWLDRLMTWGAMTGAGGKGDEASFGRVFGQDWKKWQRTMQNHFADASSGFSPLLSLKLPPEALRFDILQVEVPSSEIRELIVLSQILNQRLPASPTSLDALLARGLKTESLRPLLVEACLMWEREEQADEHLRKLIAADTPNPEVYALAAERRLKAAAPKIAADTRLAPDTAADVQTWSRCALAIEPRLVRANEALALSLALGAEVGPAQIADIRKLYRALSGNGPTDVTVGALALATLRTGDHAAAREMVELLQASPFANARAREIAAAVVTELDHPSAFAPAAATLAAPITAPARSLAPTVP